MHGSILFCLFPQENKERGNHFFAQKGEGTNIFYTDGRRKIILTQYKTICVGGDGDDDDVVEEEVRKANILASKLSTLAKISLGL